MIDATPQTPDVCFYCAANRRVSPLAKQRPAIFSVGGGGHEVGSCGMHLAATVTALVDVGEWVPVHRREARTPTT